jgi:hypothetical protein
MNCAATTTATTNLQPGKGVEVSASPSA